MSSSTVPALVFAISALASAEALAADAPSISVRVYDGSAMSASIRETAVHTARQIAEEAGIVVDWRDCSAGQGAGRCDPARGEKDLILRILPDVSADATATRSPLETHIERSPSVLGFAVTDPSTGTGVFATIYMSRVTALAERTGVPSSFLLGRVLAHEVGHLLLGPAGHSDEGLMRPIWTPAELQANRAHDWLFSKEDRQLLQRRVTTPQMH